MPPATPHTVSHHLPLEFDRLVAEPVEGVDRASVGVGDVLHVYTHNSLYRLRRLDAARFEVRGGWFDRRSPGPAVQTVTGCTWGGSAVRRDLIAGCGMRIEFGNRVTTTPVRRIVHFPAGMQN